MMKRTLIFGAAVIGLALSLGACAGSPSAASSSRGASSGKQAAPAAPAQFPGDGQLLRFTHVDGFGTETEDTAWLAWQFEALDYVKYQVAYTSCTCRPESINKRSLLYVEVTKGGTGGKIRRVWFDYWGDSPVMPEGTKREEIEKNWMPKLDNQKLDGLAKIDTMSGATVTTVNLKTILKAILEYHNAHYGNASLPEAPDYVDATSSATKY